MSPDSFVQIALNTSYYLLYGSFVTAYESVNTKHYNHGRTEAGRTLSREICEYAKKFADASISNAEKLTLLPEKFTAAENYYKTMPVRKRRGSPLEWIEIHAGV